MEQFGESSGQPVHRLVIGDPNGFRIALITYGAALTECWVPDRSGAFADVVLGWDTLEDYLTKRGCFGATCGRYANRIAKGRFSLGGETFDLAKNEGPTTLHGGPGGFHKRIWTVSDHTANAATMRLVSEAGDQGFPGRVEAEVTYRLDGPSLVISLRATTEAPTVLNMTNHAYWTMAGHDAGDVFAQHLTVPADTYLPVDGEKIPTGERRPVDGAFDFRTAKPVGRDIESVGGSYDHNWCLGHERGTLASAAILHDTVSGRRMTVETTEPGVQLYTAAHLTGADAGKGGARYPRGAGLAIEPQNWPDAPNQAGFPDPVFTPDTPYAHEMRYTFDTE